MESSKYELIRKALRGTLKVKDSIFGGPFPGMQRIKQASSSHCGPAVLSSLFSFLGVKVSQRKMTTSIRAQNKIKKFGLSVKDMAKAAKIYNQDGDFVFWKKANATVSDLNLIINKYKFPVGVEWQGVFYEEEDEDNGHYSIITEVNKEKGYLRMADPYHKFVGLDRKFKIDFFVKRWWDTNIVNKRSVYDNRVMFVIVPKSEKFPKKIGMVKA